MNEVNNIIANMSISDLKFSYKAVLYYLAHIQLNKPLDGNLLTIMTGIQSDIEAAKKDIPR